MPISRLPAFEAALAALPVLLAPLPAQTPLVELPPTEVVPPVLAEVAIGPYGDKTSVIGRDQIRELGAGDLAAALRGLPGVTVSRYGMVGSYGGAEGGAIFIRGHGSGRPGAEIALLVDGVPRFVGVWTHPMLDAFAPDHMDRLEVHKSPQPVRYGNMAFGAVNLVPPTPPEDGPQGAATFTYGTHETWSADLRAAGRAGPLGYSLSATHRSSDGHRPHSAGETDALGVFLGYAVAAGWDVSLQVYHNEGWAEDPEPVGLTLPVGERFASHDTLGILKLTHRHGDWSGAVRFYGEDGALRWRQWGAPPVRPPAEAQEFSTNTDYRNYGIRWSESWQATERTVLEGGWDLDWYGGEVADVYRVAGTFLTPPLTFHASAPYLRVRHTFGDTWRITPSAGVRYQDNRYFEGVWGAEAGLVAENGPVRLYGNYAHAYNLAGVYAAIFSDRWGFGRQWQELEAETVDHGEAGASLEFTPQLSLDASLYRDEVRDALRFSPPPPRPGAIRNFAAYHQTGAELNLRYTPDPRLRLYAGAGWLETSRADVPNAPRQTYSLGMQATPWPDWRVRLGYQFVDEQVALSPRFPGAAAPVAAYHLADLRVTWEVPVPDGFGEPELSLQIDNLLAEDYELRPGYPMPGRVWTAGLRWSF